MLTEAHKAASDLFIESKIISQLKSPRTSQLKKLLYLEAAQAFSTPSLSTASTQNISMLS